jgi:uncharacterized membrane protein
MNFIIYLCVLIPLVVIDAAWLFAMGGNYKKWLGHLFAPTASFTPVVFFYLLYALGITFFVVMPFIRGFGMSTLLSGAGTEVVKGAALTLSAIFQIFLAGALLGFVAYGTYDLTNQATLKEWPLFVTVIDMVWGALVTGATSVLAVIFVRMFLK